MVACRNCDRKLGENNKSGLCVVCIGKDPETIARRRAGLLRTYALNPEVRKAAADRLRKATKTPEHAERGRQMMKGIRIWEMGTKACGPAGSPSRRKAGKSLSNTRMSHIPPEHRDEYRRLVNTKGYSAAEAAAIIAKQHEMEMARWRRKIGAAKTSRPDELPEILPTGLIEAVAAIFDVTEAQIRSADKTHILVDARCVLTVLLKSEGKSYPYIGRVLNKDHSSAINLYRRYEKRAQANPLIAAAVERLSHRAEAA